MTRLLGWALIACTVAIGIGLAAILTIGVGLVLAGLALAIGLLAAGVVPPPVTYAVIAVGVVAVLAFLLDDDEVS